MTMSLIATATVGAGGAAIIEFTSIPQDGTDLLMLLSGRITNAVVSSNLTTNVVGNGRSLRGNGSTIVNGTNADFDVPGASATASTFSSVNYYISNYTSSTTKQAILESVAENNATAANHNIAAGNTSLTAAVTTLSVSASFAQYSTASLYKITKGSDGTTVVA